MINISLENIQYHVCIDLDSHDKQLNARKSISKAI